MMKKFIEWSITHTKRIVNICTCMWVIQQVFSAVMICYAVVLQGNFSYLDTFITDSGETFRLIVGMNLVSKTIENVFKYNEGGIFGKSITPETQRNLEHDDEAVG